MKTIIEERKYMIYKFKECHANKVLTDLWVEPTAIWTDTVKIDGSLADCIVFIDSANNKYSFYTKDKVLLDKFMTTIEYHRIFVTQDLVVMNESHFIEECSDIKDEKKQLAVASDVMNCVMSYNIYNEEY